MYTSHSAMLFVYILRVYHISVRKMVMSLCIMLWLTFLLQMKVLILEAT